MPTYEYKCDTCGQTFEEFQAINAKPLTVCRTPHCKGKVSRLLSGGAGFLFKGSGFYITDYRSESYKKAAKAEESSGGGKTAENQSGSNKNEVKASAASSVSKKSEASSSSS